MKPNNTLERTTGAFVAAPQQQQAVEDSTSIEIVPAEKRHAALLASFLKDHLYELGAPEEYAYFAAYWSEPTRHPYFISSAGRKVGFALVREPGEGVDFEMAEFYICPGERRRRIGQTAVRTILGRLPGRWRVSLSRANDPGLQFWSRVLAVPPTAGVDGAVVFEVQSSQGAIGAV